MMKTAAATAAVALLLLAALLTPVAQARPEPDGAGGGSSMSHETDSSSEDSTPSKALCPPRQPELTTLEEECAQEEHAECTSTAAPVTEMSETTTDVSIEAAAPATTDAPVAPSTAAGAAPAAGDSSTVAPTGKPGRRQRKRSCNYWLCVLRKMEVMNDSDMPDKTLMSNWIANNVTDESQRESLQQKLTECTESLKDIFGETTTDTSKSTEEDTTDEKKSEETQPKKKSCGAAKKVMSCLLKSTECPVLKF